MVDDFEWIQEEVHRNGAPVGHPDFAGRIFPTWVERLPRSSSTVAAIIEDPYTALSAAIEQSGLQEGPVIRNCLKARALAILLIDENGQISPQLLGDALAAIRKSRYFLTPTGVEDGSQMEHMERVVSQLVEGPALQGALTSISSPELGGAGERLIRSTLQLPPRQRIGVAAARRAALSAWLTFLRQNVGSCFATAPAIQVQVESPDLLLADLTQLLSTERLGRVIDGVEYSVPLSLSWGQSDLVKPFSLSKPIEKLAASPGLQAAFVAAELMSVASHRQTLELLRPVVEGLAGRRGYLTTAYALIEGVLRAHRREDELEWALEGYRGLAENALLKSWEFSIASFSEARTEATRWNFTTAVGLRQGDRGGIGELIEQELTGDLEEANREVESQQMRYEQLFLLATHAEQRLRRATEEEGRWLEQDYRRKAGELEGALHDRDRAHARASRIAHLGRHLVERYDALFPSYFQEIYDADMHGLSPSPYDDSPAGFRLIYKYGRAGLSQWSPIEGSSGFTDALADFFAATERHLAGDPAIAGVETELSRLVTRLITHVRTPYFLESALERLAHVHGQKLPRNPLDHLDQIDKKPWAYTSGGTMAELVAHYSGTTQQPKTRERVVESPTDLFCFLLDLLKEAPVRVTEPLLNRPDRSLLMESPTHAFRLQPGRALFCEGWLDRGNTYTWVRDQVIEPQLNALSKIWLGQSMQEKLIKALVEQLPEGLRAERLFSRWPNRRMRPRDLRKQMVELLRGSPLLRGSKEQLMITEVIDALLFSHLPFIEGVELRDRVEQVVRGVLGEEGARKVLRVFDAASVPGSLPPVVPAHQLHTLCVTLSAIVAGRVAAETDLPKAFREEMEGLGLRLPAPILFADTNWTVEAFGFLVNPGTGQLDLWRTDRLGLGGAPMGRWRGWLDGSSTRSWAVYV